MPAPPRRLELLLLCDFPADTAENVNDSIQALLRFSRHRLRTLVGYGPLPSRLDLNRFDGVIVHWTIAIDLDNYMHAGTRRALRAYPGLKAVFVQDDYRAVGARLAAIRDLGLHIVFGVTPREVIDRIYPAHELPGVRREIVLPGYVADRLLGVDVPAYRDRPVDVGYRGRTLPAWVGRDGLDKRLIGERFQADAARYGLTCDISSRETDRLYGARWVSFLTRCKAVLGVECAAGVFDYSGSVRANVEAHLARDRSASWDELYDRHVRAHEEPVPLRTIPPRCFEAAALRTLMVLHEGRYSDRLEPWRHYVPLRRDHSNMDEVVAVLRDPVRAQDIVDRAYKEVALDPDNNFAALARRMDAAIDEVFEASMAARAPAYSSAAFRWRIQIAPALAHRTALTLASIVRRSVRRLPDWAGRTRLHGALRILWRRWLQFLYAQQQ